MMQIQKMVRKSLTTSKLGLLEASRFQPLLQQEQVVLDIVLLTLLIPLIILVVACLTYWIYVLEKNNRGFTAVILKFIEYALPLALSYIGFDLIKEYVLLTISSLCQKEFLAGQESVQNQLEKLSENRIKSIYDRKYLSHVISKRTPNMMYETIGAFSLEDINFEGISESIKRERLSDSEKLERNLENVFLEETYKRDARWEVVNLPDKFWKSLSLSMSMNALGISETYKLSMNSPPNSILWRDIYVYLKAWLVCSIDNDIDVTMPISAVGLNYPNKINPDKNAYKQAFNYFLAEITSNPNIASKSLRTPHARVKLQEYVEKLLHLIDTEY